MARNVIDAIRELCLWFPATEETTSHGKPDFKVKGKAFAYLALNLHGDGRAALWLASPQGAQELHTRTHPKAYFIPPYLGKAGWLGMDINGVVAWDEVKQRVCEAWRHRAPVSIHAQLPETIDVDPPESLLTAEEIDPMLGERARSVISRVSNMCGRLPETSQDTNLGSPVWKAGKKVFARAVYSDGRLHLQFWVGLEQQSFLVSEPRYKLPIYYANNGWVELEVEDQFFDEEVESLLEQSYRHFALKRMLAAIEAQR